MVIYSRPVSSALGGTARHRHSAWLPLHRFFTRRLSQERQVSPHMIGSYLDTFRQFLKLAGQRLHKAPLTLRGVDRAVIALWLGLVETTQVY
jgi:hypothetical protein